MLIVLFTSLFEQSSKGYIGMVGILIIRRINRYKVSIFINPKCIIELFIQRKSKEERAIYFKKIPQWNIHTHTMLISCLDFRTKNYFYFSTK